MGEAMETDVSLREDQAKSIKDKPYRPKIKVDRPENENVTRAPKVKGKRKNDDLNLNMEVPAKKRFGELDTSEGRPDWAKLRQEKKLLKRKRKLKESKPGIYELSQEAKLLWEALRPESCPANKKIELSKRLYEMLAPHLQKVVFTHDVVRVIECLVAVGGQMIRQSIFEALKPDLMLLMKSTYSHFLVLKFLKYGTKSQRIEIIKSFEGHVVSLMKHKIAASVVENAYNDFANAVQRFKIIKEFFGPEFRIFTDTDCSNLKSVIDKYPAKRQGILNNLKEALLKLMEKEQWGLTMLHTLLFEFLSNCDPQTRTDVIPLALRGLCDILHTRDGARVAMICIWYGSAKDRKQIIKSLKPHVEKVCLEEHGHMVLLALLDCVDDTALLSKAIVQEIMKHIEQLMGNQHGRKVLHYILTPKASQYFHPNILSILREGDGKSKKESTLRQEEILAAAHPDFIDSIESHAKVWSEINGACLVISSALLVGKEDKEPAFKAIAKLATETETAKFIEKSAVFKMMKDLVSQAPNEDATSANFSVILIQRFDSNVLKSWISCNRGCLLLAKLLEGKSEPQSESLLELLRPLKKKVKSKDFSGSKILLDLINK